MQKSMRKSKEKEAKPKRQTSLPPAKKKVDVVTGPTSGIGIKLIKRLLEMGDEVRVIVIQDIHSTDVLHRLPAGVVPYKADITLKNPDDEKNLVAACLGADRVFHLAAITDLQRGSLETYISINVVGTENVLKACVEANPGKHVQFIYLSSISVYGSRRPGEMLTEDSEVKPSSTYGETKLMAEQVVKSFSDAHETLSYTILRASNMYGPYYEGPFNKVFKYLKLRKLRYVGRGSNHITLVHVDDVADGLAETIDNPKAMNQTFNLSDGESYTLKQLFDKAAAFLHVPPPVKSIHPAIAVIGAKVFDINRAELNYLMSDRIVSIAKIKKELGFTPKRTIDNEGASMVEEFLKRNKD